MRVLALTSSSGLLFFVVLYQVWQSNRRLHYPALLVSHFLFVVSQGHDSWHFFAGQCQLVQVVGLTIDPFLVRFSYDRYTNPTTTIHLTLTELWVLQLKIWSRFQVCRYPFGTQELLGVAARGECSPSGKCNRLGPRAMDEGIEM